MQKKKQTVQNKNKYRQKKETWINILGNLDRVLPRCGTVSRIGMTGSLPQLNHNIADTDGYTENTALPSHR